MGDEEKGDVVSELAADILQKVPVKYDIESVSKKYPIQYMNSMNTVLKQVRNVLFFFCLLV